MIKKHIILMLLVILNSINVKSQIGQTFDTWDRYGENVISCKIISEDEVMVVQRDSYKNAVKIVLPEIVVNHNNGKTYSLTEIGDNAFSKSKNLSEIILPNTLKSIGKRAFYSVENLVSISIPDNVEEIGGGCFCNCQNLKSVKLPEGLKDLKTYEYGDDLYSGFFEACYLLEKITLPKSIIKIGPMCFSSCKSLRKIEIPDGVEELPSVRNSAGGFMGCFQYCENLEEVILGKNFKRFGEHCFTDCYKLKKVTGLHCEIDLGVSYSRYASWEDYVESNAFSLSAFKEKLDSIKKTFSFYAEPKIKKQIEDWQQKKAYETTEQWKFRMTEAARNSKLKEIIAQVKNDYITQNEPPKFSGILGNYDTDYQAYPITFKDMESIYVKVPQNLASDFKKNWDKISNKASPVYGVVNNNLHIVSCTFKYKGKDYDLAQTYRNDDISNLAFNLPPLQLDLSDGNNQLKKKTPTVQIDKSLDLDIPSAPSSNTSSFAVIIGNERYTRVAQVPYANNDARIFAEYCKKTLGLPDKNVKVYENATYGAMIGAVSDIQKIAKAFKGDINVIFYYAGHGIPDEATGDGYLLPIDADGLKAEVCYPLNRLYKELGGLGAKSVVAFLDACFSGAQRGDGMVVAARGVAIKAKSEHPTGNTIVFTAATDKQTAYPYEEKGHGMFTYYLLKKLHDTKGDCTLGELSSYICDEVAKQAVVTNGKEQTPIVLTSAGVMDNWKNFKMK